MARADLTFVPRLLPSSQAAAYLVVSASTLSGLPVPRKLLGSKRLYDRLALDQYASNLPSEDEHRENSCDVVFGD
ncbi:DNA-binding protein [Paracoccus indicus]|uniref:DNA-binding protein n=1 Tax=Paracoccus indicus TaxID=2079229 RepID=UPI001FE745C9|nr:DNA-binding protein [Paracoccus indicus]